MFLKKTKDERLKISKIAKVLAFVFLLGLVVYITDWVEVVMYLREASPVYVGLFVVFHIVGLFLSSYKWGVISRWEGFDLPVTFYFKKYLMGAFINNFLPSFVGGDSYRSLALRRQDPSAHGLVGFSSVAIDRLSGLLTIFVLALFSSGIFLLIFGLFEPILRVFAFLLCIFTFLVIGIALYRLGVLNSIYHIFPATVKKKISSLVGEQDMVKMYFNNGRSVQLFCLSAVFAFCGVALSNYMLFLSIGVDISFFGFLSVIFVVSIIATLPVSIGNIGLKESAYIVFFGFLGVSVSACVAIVILSRILQLLVSLGALPMYLREKWKPR